MGKYCLYLPLPLSKMNDTKNNIENFVPAPSLTLLNKYIDLWKVNIVITRKRHTKHGDFRALPEGEHQITVNQMPNPYRFLITTLHEIAHLVTYKYFGRGIKPHGKEWKSTYRNISLPFLTSDIFPEELLKTLKLHFRNPRASSDTDSKLVVALNKFDSENEKSYIFELEKGTVFETHNGMKFILGKKRVKLYECKKLGTQRLYLFSPHAQVNKIQ